MSIDKAGGPYTLTFSTTADLPGVKTADAIPIFIGVGGSSSISIIVDMLDEVAAGEPFEIQPQLQINDLGGNLVEADSSSMVQIDFYTNPSNAIIYPTKYTFHGVRNGVVKFTNLAIDIVGKDFSQSIQIQ